MIAAHDSKQFAVGIATNVFHNDPEESHLIAAELNIFECYNQVWQQEVVKKCFNYNFDEFKNHWEKDYKWIRWKCPFEMYHWFETPILLNPKRISGRERLISMHGNYQMVLPQVVLDSTYKQLKEKPEIIEWLTRSEFDTDWVKDKSKIISNPKLRKKFQKNGKNAPSSSLFSYWVEGQRNVEPLHAKLQAKFVKFLSEQGKSHVENKDYIDVQYKEKQRTIFCEIKPTERIETKYAIRIAIGQLLEYQYTHNKTANLEIVLSSRPEKNEIHFVRSLNIRLTYFDKKTNSFKTEFT